MAVFLGYDPGGEDKHGVAAANIDESGSLLPFADGHAVKYAVVEHADAALNWLRHFGDAEALGIDTLLAWSATGKRTCDERLRHHYGDRGRQSVIQQNSLYSSMTINGAIVARSMNMRRCESHPKLLVRAGLVHGQISKHFECVNKATGNDHAGDALLAAWCANRWHFKAWTVDLYKDTQKLIFPAGKAVYPWPEAIPLDR